MISLQLTKLPQLNTIVIKQHGGRFFVTGKDTLLISEEGILALLSCLLDTGMIDPNKIEELGFSRKVKDASQE